MIIVTDGKEICAVCKQEKSVVLCNGCQRPLCESCRKFDIWGCGCSSGYVKVFCDDCNNDIDVNPYRATSNEV
ncbi:MAG: hypothetical protein IMF10_08160 [Proteobacteria bacterium]|nr:hypothetical protein [Pseudomonadota bacterium]